MERIRLLIRFSGVGCVLYELVDLTKLRRAMSCACLRACLVVMRTSNTEGVHVALSQSFNVDRVTLALTRQRSGMHCLAMQSRRDVGVLANVLGIEILQRSAQMLHYNMITQTTVTQTYRLYSEAVRMHPFAVKSQALRASSVFAAEATTGRTVSLNMRMISTILGGKRMA